MMDIDNAALGEKINGDAFVGAGICTVDCTVLEVIAPRPKNEIYTARHRE